MALVACRPEPQGNDGNNGNNNNNDDFGTIGFKRDNATSSEMFSDLIGGVMQAIKPASNEVVPSQSYKIALNFRVNIEINGVKSYIIFKSNYDERKQKDTVLMVELYSAKDDSLQIGMYLFQQNEGVNLYIHMDDNKIRIPLANQKLYDMYPVQTKFDSTASSLVAMGFELFLNVKGKIDYEYKEANNFVERHYRFYVDVPASLSKLISMSPEWQENMGIFSSELDFILQNFLGIDSADITAGNIPDTQIEVEFSTIGGNRDSFGQGKLSKIKLLVDVKSMQTGDTVFGKDFKILIDAPQLVINNSVVSNMPKEDIFADYTDYDDRKFRMYTVMRFDDGDEASDVTVDFIYDAYNADNTQFAMSAIGKDSGDEKCSIFYRNRYIYINWKTETAEHNIEGHFDFNKLLIELRLQAKNSPNMGFFSILSYVMDSLRIQGNGSLSYHFMPEFFYDLAGLNNERLLEILDDCSDEDVTALLAENSTAISEINKSFTIWLNYCDKIIEQIDSIAFPDVQNKLK